MTPHRKNKYYRNSLFRFAGRIFYTAAIPVLFVWVCLFNGCRVAGAQNLKGIRSAVTVCNHVHKLDSALVAVALYPRKLTFPTTPDKIDPFFPGVFMSLLGCVSVPRALGETNAFFNELEKLLEEGRIVHFFPEGYISPYGTELHSFKRGAFHLAAMAYAPVLPLTISFREPHGIYKFFKKHPVLCLTIGELIEPVSSDVKEDERGRMKGAFQQMTEALDKER